MSPQGVMSRKKACNGPGLNPIKSHKFFPGTQTRSRDELSCLPLGVTKATLNSKFFTWQAKLK